jgi:hypothetical protein
MNKTIIPLLGLTALLTSGACATTGAQVKTGLPEPEPILEYQEQAESEVSKLVTEEASIFGPDVLAVGQVGSYAMSMDGKTVCSAEEDSSPKGRFIIHYGGGIDFGPEDLDDNECTLNIEATRPGTYSLLGRHPGFGEKSIEVIDQSTYQRKVLETQLTEIGRELQGFNNVAMEYVSLEMVTELDLDFDIVGIIGHHNPTEEYCSQLEEENDEISDLLDSTNLFFNEVSKFYESNPMVQRVFSEQYETFNSWKNLHDSRSVRLVDRMGRNDNYCD